MGKLKAWRKVPSEFPSELILNGKTYRGEEEVLEGFADSAYEQSRDPRIER